MDVGEPVRMVEEPVEGAALAAHRKRRDQVQQAVFEMDEPSGKAGSRAS